MELFGISISPWWLLYLFAAIISLDMSISLWKELRRKSDKDDRNVNDKIYNEKGWELFVDSVWSLRFQQKKPTEGNKSWSKKS